jgi:hypothetical protein
MRRPLRFVRAGVDEVRGVWGVLWRRAGEAFAFRNDRPQEIEGWVKPPSEIWLETTSAGPTGEFFKRYTDAMKRIGRYGRCSCRGRCRRNTRKPANSSPTVSRSGRRAFRSRVPGALQAHDAQMLWRRSKIHELGSMGKFRQEYPIDVTEAFAAADIDAFIPPPLVLRARKREMKTRTHP